MSTESNQASTIPKIGEIFVEAGLVKSHLVTESLALAKRTQMPIGRVLVMAGYAMQRDVECALRTQQMVKDGQATRSQASRMLRSVHINKISLEEAESFDNCDRAFKSPFSQVGRLLLAAKIVSEKALLVGTRQSCQLRTPLGRFLVRQGSISEDLLIAAINCLILVRDKKISRIDAVRVLQKTYAEKRKGIREALIEERCAQLVEPNAPLLCDLFVATGVLTRSESAWALEMSLESNRQVGQVLIGANFIDEHLLHSALQLQKMVAERTLKESRAGEFLSDCHALRTPLEALLAEYERLNEVVAFLRRGKIFEEKAIREVAANTPDFHQNAGIALLRNGVTTRDMMDKGHTCLTYFRSGRLTEQQAIDTFNHSYLMKISPEEATRFVNWDAHNLHGEHELLGKTA